EVAAHVLLAVALDARAPHLDAVWIVDRRAPGRTSGEHRHLVATVAELLRPDPEDRGCRRHLRSEDPGRDRDPHRAESNRSTSACCVARSGSLDSACAERSDACLKRLTSSAVMSFRASTSASALVSAVMMPMPYWPMWASISGAGEKTSPSRACTKSKNLFGRW